MTASHEHGHAHGGHARVGHVVGPMTLINVLAALLFLTVVTVLVTLVNLGPLNVWIALGIATVKASLVLLYFMHLRWDRPLNAVMIIASLVFVVLFVGGALTDTLEYKGDLIPGYAPKIQK